MSHTGVALRSMTPQDEPFVFGVFSAVRGEALRQAALPEALVAQLLEQQFRAQQSQYRSRFAQADFDLVMDSDGTPIGYLYTARGPTHFTLIDIALLPAHCGRGIGTQLVGAFVEQAAAAGKPVAAHVAKGARAGRLWMRLGFEVLRDEGAYLAIERPAGSLSRAERSRE